MKSYVEVNALLNQKKFELNRKSQDPMFVDGVQGSQEQLAKLRREIALLESVLDMYDVWKEIT